jgi:hypothetical protein
MIRRISMAARTEVVLAIRDRYRIASRAARTRILDELVELTGYHRKHAIRVLAVKPSDRPARRGRQPTYGPEVRAALLALWNLSDRLCSKCLKEMIPVLLPAAVRHGAIYGDEALTGRLLSISAATIDRLLAEDRLAATAGRRRRAGMSSAIRREVPIRNFNDWGSPEPGFVEADFVVHGGTRMAGSSIQTLDLTDVATGWTECLPVITRRPSRAASIRTSVRLESGSRSIAV